MVIREGHSLPLILCDLLGIQLRSLHPERVELRLSHHPLWLHLLLSLVLPPLALLALQYHMHRVNFLEYFLEDEHLRAGGGGMVEVRRCECCMRQLESIRHLHFGH